MNDAAVLCVQQCNSVTPVALYACQLEQEHRAALA